MEDSRLAIISFLTTAGLMNLIVGIYKLLTIGLHFVTYILFGIATLCLILSIYNLIKEVKK